MILNIFSYFKLVKQINLFNPLKKYWKLLRSHFSINLWRTDTTDSFNYKKDTEGRSSFTWLKVPELNELQIPELEVRQVSKMYGYRVAMEESLPLLQISVERGYHIATG